MFRVKIGAPPGTTWQLRSLDTFDIDRPLPKTAGTFSRSRTVIQVDRPPIMAFVDQPNTIFGEPPPGWDLG